MRVCIYARISTNDQQSIPAQIKALQEYADKRGWNITNTIRETGSGAKQRPMRQKVIEAAKRREIDAVLVWKLDRWGRSVQDLVVTLKEFVELGVIFTSVTEALDFSTASGRAMAGMLGVFAEFERDLLRERVRAGIAHAREIGTKLGRPSTAQDKKSKIIDLYAMNHSRSEIARRLQIDRRSVSRILDASRTSI